MKIVSLAVIGVILMCVLTCEGADYAGWAVGSSANGYGTILRTTDSGVTWTRQGGAQGQIAEAYFSSVYAVNPLTAWVVGNAASGYPTIYNTTDGGSTWLRQGSAATLPNVSLGKVIVRGSDIWAVGQDAILHSSDGGTTWANRLPDGYGNIILQGLYTLDGKTVWVSGGNKDGYATLLKSEDAGLHWTRESGGDVSMADHLLGISAADEKNLWAVGGTGSGYIALHTTDGGTKWTTQAGFTGLYDINEVQALNDSEVWIAADNAVYRTTDGGENWNSESAGPYTLDVSAVSALQAWAVVSGSANIGEIWHTSDGGATWDVQGGMPGLSGVSFAVSAVPEPSGGALLAVGTGVFFWVRRRRSTGKSELHSCQR